MSGFRGEPGLSFVALGAFLFVFVHDLADAGLHFLHAGIHVGHQLQLGSGAGEIVPFAFRLEINIPFEVIRQEADARFQCDQQTGKRQQIRLLRRDESAGGAEVTASNIGMRRNVFDKSSSSSAAGEVIVRTMSPKS